MRNLPRADRPEAIAGTIAGSDRSQAMETLTQSLIGAAAIAGWFAFMGSMLVAARWLK